MYLLVHLFDVRALPTKVFLQTPPDFTDRIFRWSFHHSELLVPKKKCLIMHLSNEFCSQLFASCVFIDLFAYSFSSLIHFLNVF